MDGRVCAVADLMSPKIKHRDTWLNEYCRSRARQGMNTRRRVQYFKVRKGTYDSVLIFGSMYVPHNTTTDRDPERSCGSDAPVP